MDIVHTLTINTAPERIYEAVTTQAGLAGWWTPETKAKPEAGSISEFRFGNFPPLRFRVDVLEPNRVVWSTVDGPDEWKPTKITFTMKPDGDATEFSFRQGPFAPDGDDGSFNYLWGQYMRSLKLLAETGVGEPYGSAESIKAGTTI